MTLCSLSELTVQFFGLHKRTEAEIAGAFQSVLHWSASVPVDAIKVMVENG